MRSNRWLSVLAIVLLAVGCGSEAVQGGPSLISGSVGSDGSVGQIAADGGATGSDGSSAGDGSGAGDLDPSDVGSLDDAMSAADATSAADVVTPTPDSSSTSDAATTPDTATPPDATPDTATPPTDTSTTPDTTTPPDAAPDTTTPDVSAPDTSAPDAGGPPDVPPPTAVCGDLICAAGENCAFDCSATAQKLSGCASSKCGNEMAACQFDAGCVASLNVVLACLDGCKPGDFICEGICQGKIGTNSKAIAFRSCMLTKGCLGGGGGGGPICGDGKCESPESQWSCSADCKPKPSGPYCGDNQCNGDESSKSCPFDCDKDGKKAWECVQKSCPNQTASCLADSQCVGVLGATSKCALDCDEKLTCILGCQSKLNGNQAAIALLTCGGTCFL